eukprot:3797900-Prymnesium_polylepis.1
MPPLTSQCETVPLRLPVMRTRAAPHEEPARPAVEGTHPVHDQAGSARRVQAEAADAAEREGHERDPDAPTHHQSVVGNSTLIAVASLEAL